MKPRVIKKGPQARPVQNPLVQNLRAKLEYGNASGPIKALKKQSQMVRRATGKKKIAKLSTVKIGGGNVARVTPGGIKLGGMIKQQKNALLKQVLGIQRKTYTKG